MSNLSDEDRDVDIESDEDDELGAAGQYMTQAEKRAHHNALERKRRDHIKDSFSGLRDSVPNITGDKASRAQILKQATEYIEFMHKKNGSITQDIDDLKRQNTVLDQQVRALERAKRAGTFADSLNVDGSGVGHHSDNDLKTRETESDSDDDQYAPQQRKKLKI